MDYLLKKKDGKKNGNKNIITENNPYNQIEMLDFESNQGSRRNDR